MMLRSSLRPVRTALCGRNLRLFSSDNAPEEDVDAVVVGGGVVGVAIARSMALRGRGVVLLEAGNSLGAETSARNSEVIHAGLYYPPGSLKANLCVTGKALLYDYLARRSIPHERLGKILVASGEEQLEMLQRVKATAARNGVHDLVDLTAADAQALEPQVKCDAAVLSPSTGIMNTHELISHLREDAETAGAYVALNSRVISGDVRGRLRLCVEAHGGERLWLKCRSVINAAGMWAQSISASIAGIDPTTIPKLTLAKGSYFSLSGPPPFQRLVYPMPQHGGLGIHYTRDLAGRGRFGPDVEWLEGGPEELDLAVDPKREDAFRTAIAGYWPGVADCELVPEYAGARPKVVGPGEGTGDFVIAGPRDLAIEGLVCLYGIESPGLTSCMAIGEHVANILDESC